MTSDNQYPALYIEEVNENGLTDTRAFVRYDGGDTYVVYMTRRDSKCKYVKKFPDFRMEFYNRESLVNFLLYSVCDSSTANVTLFKMDHRDLYETSFSGYETLYNDTRKYAELFGYDDFQYYNYEGLMELAMVLRDMRF
jgi:hypothetical protein